MSEELRKHLEELFTGQRSEFYDRLKLIKYKYKQIQEFMTYI